MRADDAVSQYIPIHKLSGHKLFRTAGESIAEDLRSAFVEAAYTTSSHHRHDYSEIYIVESGSGTCFVDGELWRLTAGSITGLPPGIAHCWAEQDTLDGFLLRTASPLTLRPQPWQAILPTKSADRLLSVLGWMAETSPRTGNDDGLGQLRSDLCISAIAQFSQSARVHRPEAPPADLAIAFLQLSEKKFAFRWQVQDYVRALGTSRASLLRATRDRFGKSPREILDERTLAEAARLLGLTSMRCSDISEHLGFANQSDFTRAFARSHGMTPVEFRRKNAKS